MKTASVHCFQIGFEMSSFCQMNLQVGNCQKKCVTVGLHKQLFRSKLLLKFRIYMMIVYRMHLGQVAKLLQ